MVPASPDTQPWVASRKKMPFRLFVVPGAPALHVVPPLVVTRIVPLSPTAHPLLALTNHTPLRLLVVPDVCVDQLLPL